MPATLTIADLAAVPSGVTATVAGSGGAANSIRVSHGDPAVPDVSRGWVEKATLTGDGTATIPLRPGVYWAYLLTDAPEVTDPVYFRVTDGLGSVPERCFAAVRDRVRALALPCTERVYDQTFTDDPAVTYPLTIVTRTGDRQSNPATLSGRDDWGHPVRVILRDKVIRFDQTARAAFDGWRQAVVRAFHNHRLPGVPESVVCRVEFGALIEPQPGTGGKLVSEFTVRCVTREPRGLGA